MIMSKQTEVLIISFIVICIFMILFEITYAIRMKRREKRLKELADDKFTVSNLLSNPKSLKKETNLLAFESCYDAEKVNDNALYQSHFEKAKNVFKQLITKEKISDKIVKSYVVYLCTKFNFFYQTTDEDIKKELVYLVGDKNVYVRENALKCIYSIGDHELVANALTAMQNRGIHHNSKLLHDGLLEFSGDKEKLSDLLLERFDSYDLKMQLMIFTYFRYQTDKYQDFALSVLENNDKDKELHFAALRYLAKYPYDKALPTIINLAKEQHAAWEYRAIAANCLGSYKNKDAIDTLKKMVADHVWHVRKNAAESLIKLDVDHKEVNEILAGNDQFAKEQIQYKLDIEAMKTEVKA